MNFTNKPPEWENEGTEPTEEIKKIGFQAGYKPPAAFFNWFWNKTGKCIKELQEKLTNTYDAKVDINGGDVSDTVAEFTESTERKNITTGETLGTVFGKIKKWFSDLAAVAFSGKYSDLSGTPTISTSETDGLMSGADKAKLDGIADGAQVNTVTGVKGDNESSYRTGNINITKANIGLGSVPNVTTNNQTPTFTEASTRTNIVSGETLSAIFGKIKKWFADLKDVAFSNDYNDLDNTPTSMKNPNALTLSMNGTSTSYTGANAASKTWYAPTSAGTAGYELVSNGSGAPVWKAPSYAVCSTSASTAAKTASISNFKLVTGRAVKIKFTYAHTSSTAATLNVNSAGAKTIVVHVGTSNVNATSTFTWSAGETVEFLYDGAYWVAISSDMGFVKANIKKNPNATDGDIIDTHFTVGSRRSGSNYGKNSFSQGLSNTVSALEGFASGRYHNITGNYGFAANYTNTVDGSCGFACGNQCSAGHDAFASGVMNHALDYQTKFGRHAKDGVAGEDSGTVGDVFTVGIGTITTSKNGFRVDYSGKCFAYNTMSSTGADYAEVWEWEDGNPNNEDRVGRFVAFEGTKIRLAGSNDPKEILGIISAMPAIAGDNFADEWQGMYLKDKFGRLLTEHKSYEAEYEDITVTDEETGEETTETRLVHPAYEADEFIVNPEYDPTQEYIPRLERPEFDAVGTHGKLVVIDDGTCKVGGFCMSGENGEATASESGFYVMERIDENTIRVYVK